MTGDISRLIGLVDEYYDRASGLTVEAKKSDSRGSFIFPPNSKHNKSNRGRFPIDSIERARAALSYAGHADKHPWLKGMTVEQLRAKVRAAVKRKYPSIDVSEPKKKKKSSADYLMLLAREEQSLSTFVAKDAATSTHTPQVQLNIGPNNQSTTLTIDGQPVGYIQSIKVQASVKDTAPEMEVVFPSVEGAIDFQERVQKEASRLDGLPNLKVLYKQLNKEVDNRVDVFEMSTNGKIDSI